MSDDSKHIAAAKAYFDHMIAGRSPADVGAMLTLILGFWAMTSIDGLAQSDAGIDTIARAAKKLARSLADSFEAQQGGEE